MNNAAIFDLKLMLLFHFIALAVVFSYYFDKKNGAKVSFNLLNYSCIPT